MKQGTRFFLRPGAFFNQLQWSRNHWFIIITFATVAAIETYVGNYNDVYRTYAHILQTELGVAMSLAIWLITAAKIALMITGLYVFTWIAWVIGNFFGRRNSSRRVLFRRTAIVSIVLVMACISDHLMPQYPTLSYVSLLLYAWGGYMAFLVFREQFSMNLLETALMCVFSLVLASAGWHLTANQVDEVARAYYQKNMTVKQHRVLPSKSLSRKQRRR